MQEIEVRGEFITLGQLLKLAGAADTGGDVKVYLAEHEVLVNGVSDNRRGRKLYPGDSVILPAGDQILLTRDEPPQTPS